MRRTIRRLRPFDIWGWTMSGRPLNMFDTAVMVGDHDYRRIARTPLFKPGTGYRMVVSTVFLVQGVSRTGAMPPLFETRLIDNDGKYMGGVLVRTIEGAYVQHMTSVDAFLRLGFRFALPSPANRDSWH